MSNSNRRLSSITRRYDRLSGRPFWESISGVRCTRLTPEEFAALSER
jgi:hypothetical protein